MDKRGQNRTRKDETRQDRTMNSTKRKYTKLSRAPIHKMKETMAVVEVEDFVNG